MQISLDSNFVVVVVARDMNCEKGVVVTASATVCLCCCSVDAASEHVLQISFSPVTALSY